MRRPTTAAIIAALLFKSAMAWAGSGTAPTGSTWGRILLICDEHEANSARDVAEVYDPASNRFALQRPVMRVGRTGTSATIISIGPNSGRVLVVGGFNQTTGPLSSSEIYDPSTNRFTIGPNLSTTLDDHTATVVGVGSRTGWILVAALRTTNLYDPSSNRFVVGPTMSPQRVDHTATPIASGSNTGTILFAGGMERSGIEADFYDPTTNSFKRGPGMNTGRDRHTATVITSGRNAGEILLAGGYTERIVKDDVAATLPLDSTELYDPASNRFARPERTATLKVARASHTATSISSGPNAGKILIIGGEQDDQHPLSSTEIYNPATNRFEFGPALHAARTQHVAIMIASGANTGRILIAGGLGRRCDQYGCAMVPLSSTEIYDPAANMFIEGPAMRGAPGDVIAVQLPSGPPG